MTTIPVQNQMTTEPVLVIQLLDLTGMIQYKWLLTFQEMMVLPWRGQKSYWWNSNCHRSKSPLSLLKEIFSFSLHLSFIFMTLQVTRLRVKYVSSAIYDPNLVKRRLVLVHMRIMNILSYFQISHLDFFMKYMMEEMKAQINYQTCHVVWTLVFTILQLKPPWPCDSSLKQFPNMLLIMVHSQQCISEEPMLHVRICDIFFRDEIPLLCGSLTDKSDISLVRIFHSGLHSKRVGVCCLKSLWSAVLWHLCCWGCPDVAFYLKSSHIGCY